MNKNLLHVRFQVIKDFRDNQRILLLVSVSDPQSQIKGRHSSFLRPEAR